jgi:hypothetical protein
LNPLEVILDPRWKKEILSPGLEKPPDGKRTNKTTAPLDNYAHPETRMRYQRLPVRIFPPCKQIKDCREEWKATSALIEVFEYETRHRQGKKLTLSGRKQTEPNCLCAGSSWSCPLIVCACRL